jgi:hypothetical protein
MNYKTFQIYFVEILGDEWLFIDNSTTIIKHSQYKDKEVEKSYNKVFYYKEPDPGIYGSYNLNKSKNKLKYVYISPSVKVIEAHAFEWCNELQKVYGGKNIEVIESRAFAYCSNLKDTLFSKSARIIHRDAFHRTQFCRY